MELKFITYTVGLNCNGWGRVGKLVKVEISKTVSGYRLQPVSGHNLEPTVGRRYISEIDYQSIPRDPTDKTTFAIHLLDLCGWKAAGLEEN